MMASALPEVGVHVAEDAVLGAVLADPEVWPEVAARLVADDFTAGARRETYGALQALAEDGVPIDVVTLAGALRARGLLDALGGMTWLMGLVEPITLAAVGHYVAMVRQDSQRRALLAVARRLLLAANDPVHDPATVAEETRAAVEAIQAGEAVAAQAVIISQAQAVAEARADLAARATPAGAPLATPWPTLDTLGGGLARGEVIVVGALTSVGKTTMALQIATAAARAGRRVLTVSYEMSPGQLVIQQASQTYGLDRYAWLRRLNTRGGAEALTGDITRWPLDWWRAGGAPMWATVQREIPRLLRATPPLGLLVLDHLELIPLPGRRDRPEEMAEMVAQIKAAAMRYNLPILACQQLKRGADQPDREPRLSDLGWSSGIEKSADKVWLLHRRDSGDPASARRIFVRKHRDGPTGHVDLLWDPKPGRFMESPSPGRRQG